MKNLKILNKKAVKHILSFIKKQWNAKVDLNYGFLQDKENKIYIVTKDISKIPIEKLRINKIGLYLGQILNNELRLSIEGSQLIGPKAKKNILEITEKQAQKWLRGEDLSTKEKLKGFLLIKNKNDFLGTGKLKSGIVLNFVPKGRRIKAA